MLTDPDDDWRRNAACRGLNSDLFFPVGTTGPALAQTERAKAICRTCPVAAQCLEAALAHGEDDGIWGGMTPEERRRLRYLRRRRASA
ncbi:WhiB family transcriptional regulator [Flexivirga oryzae]|uniref:Transcriptional regulator WhiB n=1 Tax=Flexivirga oryzae TaxID=1794944 RepID=A0A839NBN7_9MICO|nr:WhiB family redox-sensing transcriptional regulator [Flexivirga oryzae]